MNRNFQPDYAIKICNNKATDTLMDLRSKT